MNKQLIITYFEEFKHWLNGGKVISLFRFKGNEIYQWSLPSNGKDDCCGPFLTVNDMTEYKAIIICDDYVEFRKALAEGKTVQRLYGNSTTKLTEWIDSNVTDMLNYKIEELRIKPDEPKFKVGDLVELLHTNNPRLIGVVKKLDISQAFIEWGNSRSWKSFDKLIFWQPKEDEWCWYKHLLVKVINVDKRDDGIIRYVVSAPMYAEQYSGAISLEPFTGTLPSFLEH